MIRTLAVLSALGMALTGFVAVALLFAEGEREAVPRREYQ